MNPADMSSEPLNLQQGPLKPTQGIQAPRDGSKPCKMALFLISCYNFWMAFHCLINQKTPVHAASSKMFIK